MLATDLRISAVLCFLNCFVNQPRRVIVEQAG
jgi:hypothetical protein